ncbi:MAG: hypothetical protein EP329_28635 [Deltaproteobacteria bacterium]|nr:MAG: hypothetical protein EP329_28635 [Deltaproteobacteria bacterium]
MKLKRIVAALVALTLGAPAVASAAAPKEPASKFYIFDAQAFEGTARGPGLDILDAHRKVEFGRLLELKKDLVPGIFKNRRDSVFK